MQVRGDRIHSPASRLSGEVSEIYQFLIITEFIEVHVSVENESLPKNYSVFHSSPHTIFINMTVLAFLTKNKFIKILKRSMFIDGYVSICVVYSYFYILHTFHKHGTTLIQHEN